MNLTLVIEEIIAVAYEGKDSQSSLYFAGSSFSRADIVDGCRRLVDWLDVQPIFFGADPERLDPLLPLDAACTKLSEGNSVLQQVFTVDHDHLTFAANLALSNRSQLMHTPTRNYASRLFLTPTRPRDQQMAEKLSQLTLTDINIELLIAEIMDIGRYRKRPEATTYFAQSSLQRESVAAACRRIGKWLCGGATSSQIQPVQLDLSERNDTICRSLIQENVYLQQLLQVEGRYMGFVQHLSFEQKKEIALLVRKSASHQ